MPDDVGARPFPDGDDHGDADDEFATVVFDEKFVRAAALHEPSAHERLVAAAQARAEAEAARTRVAGVEDDAPPDADHDDGYHDSGYHDGGYHDGGYHDGGYHAASHRDGPDELYAEHRPYRGALHWHRGVAWVLAVVMGIGVVALTFAAVYRGAGSGRQPSVPPPASGQVGPPSAPPVAVTPVR